MVGSNTVLEVNGKRVRARVYPWGVAEGIACDDMFLKLSLQSLQLNFTALTKGQRSKRQLSNSLWWPIYDLNSVDNSKLP